MIYYVNSSNSGGDRTVSDCIAAGQLGCITTPYDERPEGRPVIYDEWDVVLDNGCFSNRWTEEVWWEWLIGIPRTVRWAVCPDVFDPAGGECHEATLARWQYYAPRMRRHGFEPAFVCQVGATPNNLPDDARVLFLGGTTEWKLGVDAWAIARHAQAERLWLHMGRVNSKRRFDTARMMQCSSVDGTYLTFGPDKNLPQLLGWLAQAEQQPTLWGT